MIEVYTDGSASPNPGAGGWGAVRVERGSSTGEMCGGADDTTNNRMELTAIVRGLSLLETWEEAVIHSDSNYAVGVLTGWAARWEKAGWQTSTGPVKNLDLVQEAVETLRRYQNVRISWIKGHAGHRWNEEADRLARLGRHLHRTTG